MTDYTPKPTECPACFDRAYYMVETDIEGRCLACHKMLYPEGCRPLTEEEKEENEHTRQSR